LLQPGVKTAYLGFALEPGYTSPSAVAAGIKAALKHVDTLERYVTPSQ
jgi:hypothetical protein